MDKMVTRDWLRQLRPQVFEEAAELIFNRECSYTCTALLVSNATVAERDTYELMFGPRDGDYKHPFWNESPTSARQGMRQNALLFMAAMIRHARGEGRKR
jgi:hypothetical protein